MNTIIDESNGDIHQIPFFKSFLPPSRGILLIDANAATLQNRATALRRLKMDVVCANTLSAARSHWHAGTYELVLIDPAQAGAATLQFCRELRQLCLKQVIAFFVAGSHRIAILPELTLVAG
jgi:DNA-binding response OmpR family regulator